MWLATKKKHRKEIEVVYMYACPRDTSVLPEAPHLAHRDIILLLTNGNGALDRFHVFVIPHF